MNWSESWSMGDGFRCLSLLVICCYLVPGRCEVAFHLNSRNKIAWETSATEILENILYHQNIFQLMGYLNSCRNKPEYSKNSTNFYACNILFHSIHPRSCRPKRIPHSKIMLRGTRELASWNPQDFVKTQHRQSWNISEDTSSLTYFAYFAMISSANIFSFISAFFVRVSAFCWLFIALFCSRAMRVGMKYIFNKIRINYLD